MPSRGIAAVLAFFLPAGAAHAYLGLARRGAVWFVICTFAPLVVGLLVAPLGASIGHGSAALLLGLAFALRWVGPVVDVLALRRSRFAPTQWIAMALFIGGGLLATIVVAIVVRVTLVEAFKIPSGGMAPTLLVGDHIFADKLVYHRRMPRRGEVMVFAFPEHPEQDFVKRVIALPGDRLEARSGHPIINGWEVPSCKIGQWSYSDFDSPTARHEGDLYVEYLGDQSYLTFYDRAAGAFLENQGPYFAKTGEVWVMGDNRNNSHDSRMWFGGQGGGVPRDLFRGRATFIWLSVGAEGVDWSRAERPVDGAHLPASASSLQPALDACLRSRPTRAEPPPGGQGPP
jgi:signal peptidase I